jgi:hypothetical protein
LQEASEFLATEQEDGSAFWTFVDGLAPSGDDKPPRAREIFDRAGTNTTFDGPALMQVEPATLDRAQDAALGLHPVSYALLQLYLGMGAMTPTIELHRSLRKGACVNKRRRGETVCFSFSPKSSWHCERTTRHATTPPSHNRPRL